MEKPKYLIVSITEPHTELLEAIKQGAKKNKVSVSQYVRTLLYNAIAITYENR